MFGKHCCINKLEFKKIVKSLIKNVGRKKTKFVNIGDNNIMVKKIWSNKYF